MNNKKCWICHKPFNDTFITASICSPECNKIDNYLERKKLRALYDKFDQTNMFFGI